MNLWQAIIIGLVEGATEYLPVSSTGHIILAQRMMGITESEAADAFAIAVQFGAIVAVAGLYFGRIKEMVRGLLGRDRAGLMLAINIVVAFLPAAVIGKKYGETIKEHLLNLTAITFAWFVGGVAILVTNYWRVRGKANADAAPRGRDMHQLTPLHALIIGLIQCLGMWPGTSRSLVTIVGGLLVGLSVSAAVEFSFLLGLVTLTAASGYEAFKHHQALRESYSVSAMAVGFLSSAIAATLAIQWMVGYLKSRGLGLFGWYRVGLALVVGSLVALGVLDAKVQTKPSQPTTPASQLPPPTR